MQKTVLQKISVILIALLATLLLAFVSKISIFEMINSLTLMFIVACLVLVSDDFFYKLYNNRKLITKDYVIGEFIYIFGISTFALSFFAGTNRMTIIWFAISFISFFIAIGWTYYAYKNPKWTAEEIEEIKWNELRKNIPFMEKERLKKELTRFLRFRLEGDCIEGGIDTSRPFDAESFCTLQELKTLNAKPQLVFATNQYLDTIVDKFYASVKKENN